VTVHVAAVLPAYNVERELGSVLASLPSLFTTIIVVNDGSRDATGEVADRYAALDPRVTAIHHETNRGVGGAMVTGFRAALQSGADIVVKIDADGQMPLRLVPELIAPLVRGEADYAKGNRFRDFAAARAMPLARRVGNVALSFLAKAATGYWHSFDPNNGFVAIRTDVLKRLPLHKIDETYYFEISMLSHLYLIGAVVKEIPMPAQYAGEPSSLSIPRVMQQFPGRLIGSFLRRIALKNFGYDFNLESLMLLLGLPLFFAGVSFGAWKWISYSEQLRAAPTGTVVLPALLIMVGVQMLLSAAQLDLAAEPREAINQGPLDAEGSASHDRRIAHTDSEIDVRTGARHDEEERRRGGDRRRE
jgi:dolichol-phosphate mannosyltransferase